MGQLKPGATYIYERVDDIVYAREAGADPDTRFEIGRDYKFQKNDESKSLFNQMAESKLWGEIHRAAKTNPSLQEAIERVKIMYHLSKQDE